MSMHSPRRTPANKKPRGGGGSYHYRPKNKNGSGPSNTNHNGNKSGGGPSHSSKYRDGKPPGMDSGPSDDGRPADSDDKHHSFAKARSRYDRYDRFGSTSPRSSPKFGGQRQGGNRRGSGGNSDRPPPRDNRRGNGRSKFSGRAPYDDDDDEEEAFGGSRRPQRNQHKRNDRGSYERDFHRDRNNPRRDDRREDGPFDRERRYGYNDGGGNERGHYRSARPQNPHNRIPPLQLDNLINIFHDQPNDSPSMNQEKAISPPPTAKDTPLVYPVDWLMSQRKRPQHKVYDGPELPDSINRYLNPTPPPTDVDGPGGYRHKETTMASRRPEAPQGSWRKSPNVAPHQRDERDDPPKGDLTGSGDEERPSGVRRKPPLPHGSAKTLDDAVAGARQTSEDEEPQPVQKGRSREKETPEWDGNDAPEDMWGDYTFRKLDRKRDLQNYEQTGQLLEADEAVLGDQPPADKRGLDNMPPLPVSAVDSASLERQMGNTPREEPVRETDPMNEDEASDPEIVKRQIEQMQKEFNEDDDEDAYGYKDTDAAASYAGPALGVDQPDISNIANNPWHHLDLSGQPPSRPLQSGADGSKIVADADLDLKAVVRDFQEKYGGDNMKPADKEAQDASGPALPLPGNKSRSHTPIGGTQGQAEATPAEAVGDASPTAGKDEQTPRSGSGTRAQDDTPTRTGEASVSASGDGQNGGNANQNNANQVPTENQFQLYEEKVRHYYYQSVLFHQKYKKYQKLYTHAHEVMMADPSQRDPHMEKYVEKYQQHRQRFQIVYEKYRRYKQYLEHFGRKVTIPTGQAAYQQFQHGQPEGGAGGAPVGEYGGGGEYGPSDPRHYYYPQAGGGGHGPDGRYDPYEDHRHPPYGASNADPRYAMYYQQQQQYYQRYRQDGYDYDPRGPGPVPMRDQHDPRDPRDARDPRRGPPPNYGNPMPSHGPPPRGHAMREEEFYEPVHPQIPKQRVKGSAALKIEKPPRSSPGSQPNMEDDTKTTPTDPSAKKDAPIEASGSGNGANGKPAEKNANGPARQPSGERASAPAEGFERFVGDRHGEDGPYPANGANPDYNEPPEYPANFFRGGVVPHDDRRDDRRADNGGIDLSDLGYTTAPIGRERDRDRRDPQMSGMGYPPGARVADPVERSNRERALAAQYADDYMKYYAHSSGGMTRREYEEYEHRQKRRHYLEHYRRHGYYPGGSHPRGHPGGHHPPRHDGQSPPMRQASPGHPNEYYPNYPPQGHGYDQGQYYRGASPSMDYPQYYSSRGPPYES